MHSIGNATTLNSAAPSADEKDKTRNEGCTNEDKVYLAAAGPVVGNQNPKGAGKAHTSESKKTQ